MLSCLSWLSNLCSNTAQTFVRNFNSNQKAMKTMHHEEKRHIISYTIRPVLEEKRRKLSTRVDASTLLAFKVGCLLRGLKMRDVVEDLLQQTIHRWEDQDSNAQRASDNLPIVP